MQLRAGAGRPRVMLFPPTGGVFRGQGGEETGGWGLGEGSSGECELTFIAGRWRTIARNVQVHRGSLHLTVPF